MLALNGQIKVLSVGCIANLIDSLVGPRILEYLMFGLLLQPALQFVPFLSKTNVLC